MRRLMNRFLHGQGVVSGLEVATGDDSVTIVIEPGLAVDAWGRGIVVPVRTTVDLRERGSGSFTVLVGYRKTPTDLAPTLDGQEQPRAIAEGYEIVVDPDAPSAPTSVPAEPPPEPMVVLATVMVDPNGRVDVDLATQRHELPSVRGVLDRVRALEERLGHRRPPGSAGG
jgi:hypothetical protein